VPIALLIFWHLEAVLGATAAAEVGASEAKAAKLAREDAYTARRLEARTTT